MGFQFGAAVADDNTYQQAVRRKAEILAELQRLQMELKDVDGFITLFERLFQQGALDQAVSEKEAGAPRTGRRARNILPPARLAEMCRDIILETGRPMTRSELLAVIEGRGIPLAGNDPSKNLGTILWRNHHMFTNVPGRGYWIVGRPLPM